MKKLLIILLLPAMILFLDGCKKNQNQPVEESKESLDLSKIKPTPLAESESQNLIFKYNLTKGSSYSYRLTSITEDAGSLVADTVINGKNTQNLVYTVSFTTNEIDEDNVFEITFTVKSINLTANIDSKTINYQSGTQLDSLDKLRFSEYEAIVNNSFGLRLKSDGEIVELYKTGKIIDKLLAIQGYKDSVKPAEKKVLQQKMEEAGLKPIIQQVFRKLNSAPISKGNSWTIAQPFLNLDIVGFDFKNIFTVKSVDKYNDFKIATLAVRIDAQSKLSPQAKKTTLKVNKAELTGEGTVYFNLSKNIIHQSKTKVVLATAINGVVPTPRGPKKLSTQKTVTTTNILEFLGLN
jgi:Fe-S cluster assembly iron-binding protein IscA